MALRKVVICDSPKCDSVFDIGEPTYHRALVDAAHSAGWTSMSLNNVYTNLCDNCSESDAA